MEKGGRYNEVFAHHNAEAYLDEYLDAAGIGAEKLVVEHIVFEGYAPHKVPLIVEVYTDNTNRTAPEIRLLFRKGQLGSAGSNKFLFDNVGLVEAHHRDANTDRETAAIEAAGQTAT